MGETTTGTLTYKALKPRSETIKTLHQVERDGLSTYVWSKDAKDSRRFWHVSISKSTCADLGHIDTSTAEGKAQLVADIHKFMDFAKSIYKGSKTEYIPTENPFA